MVSSVTSGAAEFIYSTLLFIKIKQKFGIYMISNLKIHKIELINHYLLVKISILVKTNLFI